MFLTAASSNHFKTVKQFIRSLNGAPCIFYDIGLSDVEASDMKTLPIEYRLFDWSLLPTWAHLTSPCAGSYAWKPFIIHTVFQENHEILIWCDAGNILRNVKAVEDHVRTVHLYTPHSPGTIREWTHDACLKGMDTPFSFINLPMRNAAIVGFLPSDPDVKLFVENWKSCSLQETLIVGSRKDHRHDQSILSCLFYKFNRTCYNQYINFTLHNDCDNYENTKDPNFI